MEKFLNDFKTALAFFMDLRRIKPVDNIKTCTSIEMGYSLLDTVEGTVLYNCGKNIYTKANGFFKTLPYETKRFLAFSPNDGEYIDRAKFWKQALKPILSEKEYRIAVRRLLHWFIHCKQLKTKGA